MRFRSILPSWGIPALVVLALGWPAIRAGIGPTLPCGSDAVIHLLRVVQLDHLWAQGILYSRLAPDMGWGYGFPVFNFYPPLSYYVVLLISRLIGDIALGFRVTQALTFLVVGLGVYVLARDFFRAEAAVVTAVAAMYAPYVAYNPLYRGALPEAMGWALLPWAWWAVGRAVRTGRRGWIAAGALIFGALLLTHNLAAVVSAPLLALYALMEVLSSSFLPLRRRALSAGISLGLGMGLALFFWIPAWAERSLIQWENAIYGFPGGYRAHFLSRRELLTALEPVRPDLDESYAAPLPGVHSLLLGTPGLLGLSSFGALVVGQSVFFAAVGMPSLR
jgi:uncharacterized membrane protein